MEMNQLQQALEKELEKACCAGLCQTVRLNVPSDLSLTTQPFQALIGPIRMNHKFGDSLLVGPQESAEQPKLCQAKLCQCRPVCAVDSAVAGKAKKTLFLHIIVASELIIMFQ